jgi:hypothetical protein
VIRLIAALLFVTSLAQAESGREEQARKHFEAGQARYAEGKWREALSEFELGYALSPRPEFLVNFAQVYRRLGQHARALVECERFLATSPPPALAEQTRRLMGVIREEQARTAVDSAPLQPQPQEQPPVLRPPPVVQPAPVVVPPVVAQPPPRRSRAWIWGVVVPSVAVVGVALGVGLAVAFPTTTWPDGPRVDFK